MALKLVTAAAEYPLTLDEVKGQMRITDSDHDDELTVLIAANTEYAESLTGRALVDQTWDLFLDEFPDGAIKVPRSPLIEVLGVYYSSSGGDEQQLSVDAYSIDLATEPARIVPVYGSSWPTINCFANAIRVRFRSGYADLDASPTGSVPDDIRQAIILRIKADYDQGDDADRLRATAENMLMRKRIETGMA